MIEAINELERRILADPKVQMGLRWGEPRSGHPEGRVENHVEFLLESIDRLEESTVTKDKLRILAILHDTFKFEVDITKSQVGENHHGMKARLFAENYIQDQEILKILELHDRYHSLWRKSEKKGRFLEIEFKELVTQIRDMELYLKFMQLDSSTPGKAPKSSKWFEAKLKEYRYI